jgi:hypothetical protein
MMSTAHKLARGGRLRLVVAGAVVLTALTTATASAAPAETPARRTTLLPVFVLDKGRLTTFDAPGRGANEFQRINNRGQVVGSYVKDPGPGVGGYVRDRRGRFTEIAMPGMASTTPPGKGARRALRSACRRYCSSTTFLWISRIRAKSRLNASSAEVVPGTVSAASIFLIRSNIKFTVSSGLLVP